MNIPKPEERVALIDLDGTILDADYEITCPQFTQTIEAIQESGWSIGLSSDSPYEAMCVRREEFGMNGPIVAENGAVVEDLDGGLHFDSATSKEYYRSRVAIREYFLNQGVTVWEGNPVEAIRSQAPIGNNSEPVALLSNERRGSLALFLKRQREFGSPFENDMDLINEHIDSVRELYPSGLELCEDLNYDYGLVIVTGAEVNKRMGTQRLRQLSGLGRIAMIGNSEADHIGSDVAIHYAVQDATPEFSALADYVAKQPLTRGVTEILSQLASL